MTVLRQLLLNRSRPLAATPPAADGYGDAITALSGKVSWWRMGNTSGTTATDTVGTQNGTYAGGFTLNRPPLPTSTNNPDVLLDGVNGRVDVAHNAAHALATGSLVVWFRLSEVASDHGIVVKDGAGDTNGDFALYWRATEGLKWYILDSGGVQQTMTVANALVANQTYCAVALWGTGGMRLYLRGAGNVELRGSHAHAGGINGNSRAWMLGASNAGGAVGIPFQGVLGDVILFNRRLSEAEIETVTQGTFAGGGGGTSDAYEPAVMGILTGPAWYLEFRNNLSDRTTNARNGTLQGTGGAYVAALAPNVGTGNNAFNTQGTAWITVAHGAADVTLTFPASGPPWDSTGRHVAHVTGSLYFKPTALPAAGARAVLVAKSDGNEYGWQFLAYIDGSDSRVVIEAHTGWRKASIRTFAAVSTGTAYHLTWQLAYDGIKGWLNGAAFEDGYGNLLHVFGLSAQIRGTTHANTFAWSLGATAAGADKFNGVLDEAVLFHHALAQTNVNVLAQQAATPAALEHWVWGQRIVNATGFASIQAAIDSVNASGGGTVNVNPGTYSGALTLKSNVRVRKTPGSSGTVTITSRVAASTVSSVSLSGVGTGDLTRTLNIANTRSVGDVVRVIGTDDHLLHWKTNTTDAGIKDCEIFEIESRTSSSMTFVGNGPFHSFTQAKRATVQAWTPVRMTALEDLSISPSSGEALNLTRCLYGRYININTTMGSTTDARSPYLIASLYLTFRGGRYDDTSPLPTNTKSTFSAHGCKECVVKGGSGKARRHSHTLVADNTHHITTRHEVHGYTSLAYSDSNRGNFDSHGVASGCIFWFLRIDFGFSISGWRMHTRWVQAGLLGSKGDVLIWDGSGESRYEDFHGVAPMGWWEVESSSDRHLNNVYRNIKHSAPPNGGSSRVHNASASNYVGNTWTNVDSPGPG